MSSNLNRKEEERDIKVFCDAVGVRPQDVWMLPHGESMGPDAVLSFNGLCVSLEHTRMMNEKQKHAAAIRRNIIEMASRHVGCPCDVSVQVIFLVDATSRNKNVLACELAHLVDKNKRFCDVNRAKFLSDNFVVYMRVLLHENDQRWVCVDDHVGFVKRSEAKLSDIIGNKENMLSSYKHMFDESWLVICVQGDRESGMYHMGFDSGFVTEFDMVFVVKDFKVKRVQTTGCAR